MTRFSKIAVLCLAAAVAAGCAGAKQPRDIAEGVMRAIYAHDYKTAIAPMDDTMQGEAGKHMPELDDLSSHMHEMGQLDSFTQTEGDTSSGHYRYLATFDKGTLGVSMILDSAGKISYYHVDHGD